MKKNMLLIAGATLLISAFSAGLIRAQTCIQPPTCEELGYIYSADECIEDNILRCPLDKAAVYCINIHIPQIGDILYGDGTISEKVISEKKAIGIIFDTINKLAVALTDIKRNGASGKEKIQWFSVYCDLKLSNCTDEFNLNNCGTDGKANTENMITSCDSSSELANVANNYTPEGCNKEFCQKGMWFVPAMRDLINLGKNKETIDKRLFEIKNVNSSQISNNIYWSSTEGGTELAWYYNFEDNSRYLYSKLGSFYLRPVIKY